MSRRKHPRLRRQVHPDSQDSKPVSSVGDFFFKGRPIRGVQDISGLAPSGEEKDEGGLVRRSSMRGSRLDGDVIGDMDEDGEPIVGGDLLHPLNAHHETGYRSPSPTNRPIDNGRGCDTAVPLRDQFPRG